MPGLYMTVANGGQEHRDQLITRTRQFLEKMDELTKKGDTQAAVHAETIRKGWVAIGGGRTFTISEPEDGSIYNPWYGPYAWNDIVHLEVIPVITVSEFMWFLDNKEDPLKEAKRRIIPSPRR